MYVCASKRISRAGFGLAWVAAVLAPGLAGAQSAAHPEAADPVYVSPWRTPWTYQGERGNDHWSELDPQYAGCKGDAQSPIDIRHPVKEDLPALRFEYSKAPVDYVINNGHTIRVNYGAPGSGDYLIVGDKRYQLTQFHFHHPSEERVGGKAYEMVVHLMHQAQDGEVAGVAVFVTVGRANPAVQQIWDRMPSTEGQKRAIGLTVNPADFLPRRAGYYAYTGSQTAPPCNEGVKWFVLKTPIELSAQQIAAFAELYPDDARPPQPLNGRIVTESR
jgi:carbonic anhydrase